MKRKLQQKERDSAQDIIPQQGKKGEYGIDPKRLHGKKKKCSQQNANLFKWGSRTTDRWSSPPVARAKPGPGKKDWMATGGRKRGDRGEGEDG